MSEQKYVTRAELMRFLVQSLDLKDTGTTPKFADVPITHEYYEDIKIASQHGIINVLPFENVGPDDPINRWRYAAYLGRALNFNIEENEEGTIKDIKHFAPGVQNIIKKLVRLDLMQLDENGNFNPYEEILSPLTPNPDLKNYIQK